MQLVVTINTTSRLVNMQIYVTFVYKVVKYRFATCIDDLFPNIQGSACSQSVL